jgi:hypothetical protein
MGVATSAWAVVPEILVPWETINSPPPGTSTQNYAWVLDGSTSYHQLGTGSNTRITKVVGFDTGSPVATELMSQGAWFAATGASTLTSFYGFGQVGDHLQFGDSSTDAIWRVHKDTGAISSYVSYDTILAHQQLTYPLQDEVGLLTPKAVTPTGEMVFYEKEADELLISIGEQSLETLVTVDELNALMGNTSISGGLGYDNYGSLYWGSNTSDGMYKRASDGTLSQVLTQADIIAVTGKTSAGFRAIEGVSPDNRVYFYETGADGILSFDPADPAGTLNIALSEAELESAPGGSDSVYELGFYDGLLTYNNNGERAVYVIPEPACLALLALGSLAVMRRRR